MRSTFRWWQCGLMGGIVLSLATLAKAVKAMLAGTLTSAEWGEVGRFAAAIFGMGFLCGLVVWAGRGLHRRIGFVGDSIVGLVVMLVFFLCCMLLFDPAMLGEKFSSAGVFMLTMGAIIGLVCGPWFGRDMRK